MNKFNKAEHTDLGVDLESDLAPRSAVAKDYNTDFDKKNKANTIEDRDLGNLETTTNNMIVAVRMRPLGHKELEKEEFEIVRIMDK